MSESSGIETNSGNKPKLEALGRTFEFKMCKKVAELTQVVHMLFVKNHEKEVEINALKNSYNYEIALAVNNAEEKIIKLKGEIKDKKSSFEQVKHNEQLDLQNKLREQEQHYQNALESKSNTIIRLEMIIDDLKIKLAAIEKTKCEFDRQNSEILESLRKQLESKNNDVLRLEQELRKEESGQRQKEYFVEKLKKEHKIIQAEVDKETKKTHILLSDLKKERDILVFKNQQLEHDFKNLKKSLNKKRSFHKEQLERLPPRETCESNYELEKLKSEVKMYRMELSNREYNFNRMFAGERPVRIDNRDNGNFGSPKDRSSKRSENMGSQILSTDKTRPSSTSGTPTTQRLPVLGMENRRAPSNITFHLGNQRWLQTREKPV